MLTRSTIQPLHVDNVLRLDVPVPVEDMLTLQDAKDYMKVDGAAQDGVIGPMIKTATRLAEDYTGRFFIERDVTMFMDHLPESILWLPRPPLVSVTTITVHHEDATDTIVPSANYLVDTAGQPGRVALKNGNVWPTSLREINGFEVVYKAGYATTLAAIDDDVKAQIQDAIKVAISVWFEQRGQTERIEEGSPEFETSMRLPGSAKRMLDPLRVRSQFI